MRSGNTTPLCAIEDWSGAGFHTKQPLNVGQPTVSQVVSSPNNQSCLDPTKGNTPSVSRPTTHKQQQPRKAAPRTTTTFIGKREREEAPARWIVVGLLLVVVVAAVLSGNVGREARGVGAAGRNGKQASASKILLSWARGLFGRRRRPQGSPSRRRTSESPVEFSFPPDADSRGLSIGMTDGGVRPSLSKAVWSPH